MPTSPHVQKRRFIKARFRDILETMIQFDEDKQKQKLDQLHHKEEEELVQTLSGKYGLPYVDLSSVAVNSDALRHIGEKEAREARIAAFAIVNKKLSVAVRDPSDEKYRRRSKS